jgi:hypothetical protein
VHARARVRSANRIPHRRDLGVPPDRPPSASIAATSGATSALSCREYETKMSAKHAPGSTATDLSISRARASQTLGIWDFSDLAARCAAAAARAVLSGVTDRAPSARRITRSAVGNSR